MKKLVALVVLFCVWDRFASWKSIAAPSPQYQYSGYSHQSGYSGSNYVSNHVQHHNIGGNQPNVQIRASRHYHSDPRCETFCRKHSWSCNSQGMCRIVSKRSCLLRVYPNYIPPVMTATCEFIGNGTKGVLGKVTIRQKDDGAHYTGELSGLSKGYYGINFHQNGDLGDDCKAAGEYFNPYQIEHVGDLGINVEVQENGIVEIDMKDRITFLSGTNSIIGKSIVIQGRDDKFSEGVNGTGDAGAIVGCCRIVKSYGSSNRPTVRPTRPTVRPARPTVRPTRPTVHPTRTTVRPTRPTVHPNRPTVHPTDKGSEWFIDNNGAETNKHHKEEDDHDDNSDNVLEASGNDNEETDEEGFVWDW